MTTLSYGANFMMRGNETRMGGIIDEGARPHNCYGAGTWSGTESNTSDQQKEAARLHGFVRRCRIFRGRNFGVYIGSVHTELVGGVISNVIIDRNVIAKGRLIGSGGDGPSVRTARTEITTI
jgi:hypothetical protein